MRKKLLYLSIKGATVALSFFGVIACVITEACSLACDALDEAAEKLERHPYI